MSIPQGVYLAAVVAALRACWRSKLPWLRFFLVLSLAGLFYRPGPQGAIASLWLATLVLSRLALCLEVYSLLTLQSGWNYGREIFWPTVFAAAGLTLYVVAETLGGAHGLLVTRRYLQIWLYLWFSLALGFIASQTGWKWDREHGYALLVWALIAAQASGSAVYLSRLDLARWRSFDGILYTIQGALLLGIAGLARARRFAARGRRIPA